LAKGEREIGRGKGGLGRKTINEKDVMYEMKYLNKFFEIASL
jgi:hypothetical protein